MRITDAWISEQVALCAGATQGPYKIWQSYEGRTWLNGIGGKPIALLTDDALVKDNEEGAGISSAECVANARMLREAATNYLSVLGELQRLRTLLQDSILRVD